MILGFPKIPKSTHAEILAFTHCMFQQWSEMNSKMCLLLNIFYLKFFAKFRQFSKQPWYHTDVLARWDGEMGENLYMVLKKKAINVFCP